MAHLGPFGELAKLRFSSWPLNYSCSWSWLLSLGEQVNRIELTLSKRARRNSRACSALQWGRRQLGLVWQAIPAKWAHFFSFLAARSTASH